MRKGQECIQDMVVGSLKNYHWSDCGGKDFMQNHSMLAGFCRQALQRKKDYESGGW